MAQDRLAVAIGVSKSLVQSFESGKLVPQEGTAARLDDVLGTGDEIQRLAKDEREDRQPWLRSWFDQERRAVLIRTWDLALIPGLLQREGYMRELFTRGTPGEPAGVDELVRDRRERQSAVLDRDPPVELSCLIGESALRQGSREVMKDQLEYLADVCDRPRYRIMVVPDGHGLHAGLGGSISLATMANGRRVGRLDDPLEGKTVSDQARLIRLELALEMINGLALSVTQSRDVILEQINALK